MPTFSAIAFDQLIEPGASNPVDNSDHHSVPTHNFVKHPPPRPKLERRNSASTVERKVQRPQLSPALYATPAPTPLPDSPSSFPPSPYIINHKRRGPRLLKSNSEINVSSHRAALDEENVNGNVENEETKSSCSTEDPSIEKEYVNGSHDCASGSSNKEPENTNEKHTSVKKIHGSSDSLNRFVGKNGSLKLDALHSDRDTGEVDGFFETQESIRYASSTEGEDNAGLERATKLATPMGEFFDAREELSFDGPHSSFRDIEAELHELRLDMSLEIVKRRHAEESLHEMKSRWQRMRQQLAQVGLTLPADPTAQDGQQPGIYPTEELCQQVYVARFVSESIGMGIAKAEVEKEMETHLEAKNFEIARLLDRLHYYEAVNHEMSQRNQEAVEMARRQRQVRKKKQMWVWGSIGAVVTLGSAAALVWSYLPEQSSSSSGNFPQASERGDASSSKR